MLCPPIFATTPPAVSYQANQIVHPQNNHYEEDPSSEAWSPSIFEEEGELDDDEPSSEFGLHAFEPGACLRDSREVSPEELALLKAKISKRKKAFRAGACAAATTIAFTVAFFVPGEMLQVGLLGVAALFTGMGIWLAWP